MKKSNLWWAVGLMGAGLAVILPGVLWKTPISSILCGMGGALIGTGGRQAYQYWKWTRPENAAAYQEHLEQEQIDLHDERKEMLRNKSGRYAYVLGMLLGCLAILAFSILTLLEVLTRKDGMIIVLFLSAYLLIQYAAGILFYRWLEKDH